MLFEYELGTGLSPPIATYWGAVHVDGQEVGFTVREADEGGTDLNGDGDAVDMVLFADAFSIHAVDEAEGVSTWTATARRTASCPCWCGWTAFSGA